MRDNAQDLRRRLWESLRSDETGKADSVLQQFLSENVLNEQRDWILSILDERQGKLADPVRWDAEDVRTFARIFRHEPRSDYQLFRLVGRLLRNFKSEVEKSESAANRRQLRDGDLENVFRGLLARKLEEHSLKWFSATEESEADLEQRPDATPPNLFRGQRVDWPLLPKLARLYNENRLKWAFLETEGRMLEQFARQAHAYVPNNQTDWDWLALAQHHGMATRMLDWTENPLLALWFAVQKESKDGRPGVVWVFSPTSDSYVDASSSASPFASRSTKVLQPRHSNMRLRVQSGWFTVHHFREDDGRFIQLERHKKYGKQLKKIEIDGDAFSQLRCDLDRCGVNAGTMFPDVTGLAQHIEWQCTVLEDERQPRGISGREEEHGLEIY